MHKPANNATKYTSSGLNYTLSIVGTHPEDHVVLHNYYG